MTATSMIANGDNLRQAMRRLPSPVTIVTAGDDREQRGITIGSLTSVSLDPPLVSFNISRDAQMFPLITRTERFNVHILGEDQAHLGNHFAIPDLSGREQFESVRYRADEYGIPVLDGVVVWLQCFRYALYDAGDHVIIVGETRSVELEGDTGPLVYYDRAYRSLGGVVEIRLPETIKDVSTEAP